MPTTDYYQRISRTILRDIRVRLTVAHLRVIRLRLLYYMNLAGAESAGRVPFLWLHAHYAVYRMLEEGHLVQLDGPWFTLPEYSGRPELGDMLLERNDLLTRWNQAAQLSGHYAEELVRQALKELGYSVAQGPVRIAVPGEPKSLELDVFVPGPLPVAIECKNVLTEPFYAPGIASRETQQLQKVARFFRLAHQVGGIRPVLVAPMVDPSFQGWQAQYNGHFVRTLFQYLKPDYADLCDEIREVFRFGHVKAVDELLPATKNILRRVLERVD